MSVGMNIVFVADSRLPGRRALPQGREGSAATAAQPEAADGEPLRSH